MSKETKTPEIYCGTKFFRFTDSDSLEVIRVKNIDYKKKQVRYLDSDKKKKSMSIDFLLDNYTKLKADGMIMLSVVMTGEVRDVIVAFRNLDHLTTFPDVICRQGINDFFSQLTNRNEEVVFVGISVSQDSCPANVKFSDVLSCSALKNNFVIAVYIDDSLEDILELFSHKRYDDAIKEQSMAIKRQFYNKIVQGACESLKELLINNNFMFDIRKAFKIMELPFHIDPKSEQLSNENILYMENEMQINIMETYLIPFSKEYDLDSFHRDWVLVSSVADKFDKLYICGYDKADGKYVNRSGLKI